MKGQEGNTDVTYTSFNFKDHRHPAPCPPCPASFAFADDFVFAAGIPGRSILPGKPGDTFRTREIPLAFSPDLRGSGISERRGELEAQGGLEADGRRGSGKHGEKRGIGR